jgi:antitoxin CptB
MSEHDRIRWRCRRGMLELDLVLGAFCDRYLEKLQPSHINVLRALLERPDPQLLDYVMAHEEPEDSCERELVALMRSLNIPRAAQTSLA